ncbi:MAG: hypothetical protein H6922_00880 [Pseudomonadaceae bacterium]|nr:hypothetical protein [Pseudomonadaceae bacterium]
MIRHLVLAALLFTAPAWADVPLGPQPTTQLGKAWEDWKAKLPSWADYTPGAFVFKNLGRMGANTSLLVQKAKNLRAYDRYCGSGAPYTQQPFCMAVKPSLRKRSTDLLPHAPLWLLFDSLIDRAGPNNQAAVDAAKLLLTFRGMLEYPSKDPSHPDVLIGLLYGQFANCVPNTCQVALTRPAGMATAMKGLLAYFQTYGGETDQQAVKLLHRAGF